MTNYIIDTKVSKIQQKPLGWFVLFHGSQEYICLGQEKPDLEIGQLVTIRIEPQ